MSYKEHTRVHPGMAFVQELLRKTSVIDLIKFKARKVGGGISLDLLPDFFYPNFFSLSSRSVKRKFRNATQLRKKRGTGIRVDHIHLQLQTGRWMNLLVIDHEPTPSSDAHVCAPCNLIKATAFPTPNIRDESTSLIFIT
jgi:hypothetical protein